MLYTFFFSSIEHLAFSIQDLGYISLFYSERGVLGHFQ